MGRDKALLEVNGEAMSSIVARALVDAGCSEVMAIGGNVVALQELAPIDLVLLDRHPGEGPLGGILTALHVSKHDIVVVLACDTPSIDARTPTALVNALSSRPSAAVACAVAGGRLQPLTAAWRKSRALTTLQQLFDNGERAPRCAFPELEVLEVADLPPDSVHDVDEPGDLERYALVLPNELNPNEVRE